MLDRLAFLRTIIANPGDDAPRLVFADYLDENGEHDQARFIRTQCQDVDGEAFTLGITEETPVRGEANYNILTRRSNVCPALLSKAPKTWDLIQIAKDFGHWKMLALGMEGRIDYRRGFITRMHLSAKTFFEQDIELFSQHPIEQVAVHRGRLLGGDGYLYRIPEMPHELQISIENRLSYKERYLRITEEIALQAVSEECIRYGRKRAGIE